MTSPPDFFDPDLLASIGASPIATVVTDARAADNPIIAVNPAFERLTGFSEVEVLGQNCRFLVGPDGDQAGSALLREAIRDVRPVLSEVVNYRKDGSRFRNAVMIAPLFDAEGRLLHFVGSQMEVAQALESAADVRNEKARFMLDRLTRRQLQVLGEMALGYRNKQIAGRLGLSEKTIKMHRSAMLARLEAKSSTDAIRLAIEAGL